jgi:hypothetical protein
MIWCGLSQISSWWNSSRESTWEWWIQESFLWWTLWNTRTNYDDMRKYCNCKCVESVLNQCFLLPQAFKHRLNLKDQTILALSLFCLLPWLISLTEAENYGLLFYEKLESRTSGRWCNRIWNSLCRLELLKKPALSVYIPV